jgi:hypothetical protein
MNLRNMFFWNTSPAAAADDPVTTPALAPAQVADALSNVIHLPPRSPLDLPAGLEPADTQTVSPKPASNASQPAGLMDTFELKAFFAENFFGLGRHNGSTYRTQEALAQGKQGMVSRFQNTVATLIEQRQAKIDRLRVALAECAVALDMYASLRYPGDHPHFVAEREYLHSVNPARLALNREVDR